MTDAPHRLHDVTSDGAVLYGTVTRGQVSHRVRVPLRYGDDGEDGAARADAIKQFREAEIQAAGQYQPGCRRLGP